MKIEFEGRVYDYDLDELDVKQALKIEKHIGGTLLDWEQGMMKASTPCVQALGWMILNGGDSTPIDDVNFKVMKLAKAWAEAAEAEATASAEAARAEAEADPTPPPARSGSLTGPLPGSSPTG